MSKWELSLSGRRSRAGQVSFDGEREEAGVDGGIRGVAREDDGLRPRVWCRHRTWGEGWGNRRPAGSSPDSSCSSPRDLGEGSCSAIPGCRAIPRTSHGDTFRRPSLPCLCACAFHRVRLAAPRTRPEAPPQGPLRGLVPLLGTPLPTSPLASSFGSEYPQGDLPGHPRLSLSEHTQRHYPSEHISLPASALH